MRLDQTHPFQYFSKNSFWKVDEGGGSGIRPCLNSSALSLAIFREKRRFPPTSFMPTPLETRLIDSYLAPFQGRLFVPVQGTCIYIYTPAHTGVLIKSFKFYSNSLPSTEKPLLLSFVDADLFYLRRLIAQLDGVDCRSIIVIIFKKENYKF